MQKRKSLAQLCIWYAHPGGRTRDFQLWLSANLRTRVTVRKGVDPRLPGQASSLSCRSTSAMRRRLVVCGRPALRRPRAAWHECCEAGEAAARAAAMLPRSVCFRRGRVTPFRSCRHGSERGALALARVPPPPPLSALLFFFRRCSALLHCCCLRLPVAASLLLAGAAARSATAVALCATR